MGNYDEAEERLDIAAVKESNCTSAADDTDWCVSAKDSLC